MNEEKLNYGLMSEKPNNTIYDIGNSEIIEFRNEIIFWSNRVAEIVKYYHSALDSEQTKELVDLISAINKAKAVLSNDPDTTQKMKKTSSFSLTSSSSKKRLSQNLHPAPFYRAPQKVESSDPPIHVEKVKDDLSKKDTKPKKSKSNRLTEKSSDKSTDKDKSIKAKKSKKLDKTVSTPKIMPSHQIPESEGTPDQSDHGGMDTNDQVKLGLALIKAVKYIDDKPKESKSKRQHPQMWQTSTSIPIITSPKSSRRHHQAKKVEKQTTEFPTIFMEDFARMKELAAQQQETINRLQMIASKK
jgi:hypothetical protein